MPAPQTIVLDLQRSDGRPIGSAYWGATLNLQLNSIESFAGSEIRVELHSQRIKAGQVPLAGKSLTGALEQTPVATFSAAQMAFTLGGQKARSVYVIVRSIDEDGTRSVHELGMLEILSNPASDAVPAEPVQEFWATTEAVAAVNGRASALEAVAALDVQLFAWTNSRSAQLLEITRDADEVIVTATVRWPDGKSGIFTTLAKGANNTVDAFSMTWNGPGAGKIITQPLIERTASGAALSVPPLVIADNI